MLNFDLYSLLFLAACYLIGSIPFGYLVVQLFHSKDITKEGSRNVGTLNAYKVSQSKFIAVTVLLLDFLKGAFPVYVLIYIFKLSSLNVFVLSLFIILGHNYPVWLKFRGGRGLASAAGIFLVINYVMLISWCLVWVLFFSFKKDVLPSNILATVSMPVFAVAIKKLYFSSLPLAFAESSYVYFVIFVVLISSIILIKHKEAFSRLFPSAAKNLNK